MDTPHTLASIASRTNHIFDVDDCLFPQTNGIHVKIKNNIIQQFNALSQNDAALRECFTSIVRALGRENDFDINNVGPNDLEAAFLPMVTATRQTFGDDFYEKMNYYYNIDYSAVQEDKQLVTAFNKAADAGKEIFIYTNGPSHPEAGQNLHAQNILERLGFDSNAIEFLRTRTYDLLKSEAKGRGKPYLEGFKDMLTHFDLDPHDSVFYDDTVPNIVTGHKLGVAPVWVWNGDTPPSPEKSKMAQDIGAYRIENTATTFSQVLQLAP